MINVTINDILEKKNISQYRLSKESGIPQATISDLCSSKTSIKKCSANTIYKLSRVLNISMNSLMELEVECQYDEDRRPSFEVYKSSICHLLKDKGDTDFLIDTLSSDEVRTLYNRLWYAESFYLLGMIDYISRVNNIPMCTRYNDIRNHKLSELLFPEGVLLLDEALKTDRNRTESLKNAIPEFLRFNIVECEVRNVC